MSLSPIKEISPSMMNEANVFTAKNFIKTYLSKEDEDQRLDFALDVFYENQDYSLIDELLKALMTEPRIPKEELRYIYNCTYKISKHLKNRESFLENLLKRKA